MLLAEQRVESNKSEINNRNKCEYKDNEERISDKKKHVFINIMKIILSYLPNSSAQAEYDTRSIF